MRWQGSERFFAGGKNENSTLKRLGKSIFAALSLGALSVVLQASCATQVVPPGPGDDTGAGLICLLHNCNTDAECTGCSLARSRCLPATHQCVACDSETASGCVIGERCSE